MISPWSWQEFWGRKSFTVVGIKGQRRKSKLLRFQLLIGLNEENSNTIAITQDSTYAPKNAKQLRTQRNVSNSKVTLYKNMNLVSSWINCMEIYVQDFSEGAIELRFFCLTCMKLKLMAFFHQVEGFFVISLRHPQSTIFKKGGSSLGCEFLEMIASTEEKYTVGHFHTWVAAQAIQILNGQQINAPNTKKQKTITAETLTTTT